MFPNDAGTAHTGVRPCRLPATSPTAISRPGCRTGNGPRTSPGIRAGDGKGVPLAAGRLPRRQDRRMHGRFRSRRRARRQDARQGRGDAAGGSASPGAFRPRMPLPVARIAGAHGPLRPDTVDGRKGRSPDNAAAEGFLGRMRTESVHPGHWEERTRDGVLVPIDDCIRWYDHERIKRPLGWMSPVQIPSKPGNGCVTISKKTSTAPSITKQRMQRRTRLNY